MKPSAELGVLLCMKTIRFFPLFLLFALFFVVGCAPTSAELPPCDEPTTNAIERINDDNTVGLVLPPCYERDAAASFPVLIWAVQDAAIRDSAETMMADGSVDPFILVIPSEPGGKDYEVFLAEELMPYLEERYRILPESTAHAIGGISHGGAIAARTAWRYPALFGVSMTVSGGIRESEIETMAEWVSTSAEIPTIMVDIGSDDSIVTLTDNYRSVLDSHDIGYDFSTAPGGHNSAYFSAHAPDYLTWLNAVWNGDSAEASG